ncbi:MAG: hypothetical protein CFH01_01072 [Alphaproteobacteria bacterium MarineAlpha2_Bin1]|nr:MAG: hypothetical protein CFH01_01072 [Alphaproteobacteria bacterium MarineAlpha2_Bin1]|tara:strand:- start:605 stop:1156 length:552 start_codon:yes stop_codon:yes gene_type:complete
MIKKQLIFPGSKTPELQVNSVKIENWTLSLSKPKNFTLIIIYRGFHCPICCEYLKEFDEKIDKFSNLGTNLIAISTDNKNRAIKSYSEWGLKSINIGFNLTPEKALEWGLFLSRGIPNSSLKIAEPEIFVEPGLFLVDSNMKLYLSNIQSMPFTRPPVSELLTGIRFAIDKNYPARGTLKYLK